MFTQFFENLKTVFSGGFWRYEFLGNGAGNYLAALGIFVLLLAIFKIFQALILRRLQKLAERTKTDIDDVLVEIVGSVKPPFYSFLAFYAAFSYLAANVIAQKIIYAVLIIWVVYQVIIAVQILINYVTKKTIEKEESKASKSPIAMIGKITKAVLWMLGVLLILSNLGVDITSLIAGLGIGGIAIALALQNILSDLFSSFAIYFDKPFVTGDFIMVGEYKGTVEKIGIKTTRIRSNMGEEIVISNQELTSTRVRNYKRMEERRNVFSIGVTYDTSVEKLRLVPGIIKKIIESVEFTRFDRVHFASYGDFSLNFEISYYALTTDYSKFMDVKQEINLAIKEAFEKEKIEFAYPTQTVYMAKS